MHAGQKPPVQDREAGEKTAGSGNGGSEAGPGEARLNSQVEREHAEQEHGVEGQDAENRNETSRLDRVKSCWQDQEKLLRPTARTRRVQEQLQDALGVPVCTLGLYCLRFAYRWNLPELFYFPEVATPLPGSLPLGSHREPKSPALCRRAPFLADPEKSEREKRLGRYVEGKTFVQNGENEREFSGGAVSLVAASKASSEYFPAPTHQQTSTTKYDCLSCRRTLRSPERAHSGGERIVVDTDGRGGGGGADEEEDTARSDGEEGEKPDEKGDTEKRSEERELPRSGRQGNEADEMPDRLTAIFKPEGRQGWEVDHLISLLRTTLLIEDTGLLLRHRTSGADTVLTSQQAPSHRATGPASSPTSRGCEASSVIPRVFEFPSQDACVDATVAQVALREHQRRGEWGPFPSAFTATNSESPEVEERKPRNASNLHKASAETGCANASPSQDFSSLRQGHQPPVKQNKEEHPRGEGAKANAAFKEKAGAKEGKVNPARSLYIQISGTSPSLALFSHKRETSPLFLNTQSSRQSGVRPSNLRLPRQLICHHSSFNKEGGLPSYALMSTLALRSAQRAAKGRSKGEAKHAETTADGGRGGEPNCVSPTRRKRRCEKLLKEATSQRDDKEDVKEKNRGGEDCGDGGIEARILTKFVLFSPLLFTPLTSAFGRCRGAAKVARAIGERTRETREVLGALRRRLRQMRTNGNGNAQQRIEGETEKATGALSAQPQVAHGNEHRSDEEQKNRTRICQREAKEAENEEKNEIEMEKKMLKHVRQRLTKSVTFKSALSRCVSVPSMHVGNVEISSRSDWTPLGCDVEMLRALRQKTL
nr:hypothetical protein TgIb.1810c [Toxoplasma gondii RH]